jgi:hypothetical protein
MSSNPYAAKAQRWAVLTLASLGCIGFGLILAMALMSGSVSGCFSRRCVASHVWTAATHPTQYWFYVLLVGTAAFLLGLLVIRTWRTRT